MTADHTRVPAAQLAAFIARIFGAATYVELQSLISKVTG